MLVGTAKVSNFVRVRTRGGHVRFVGRVDIIWIMVERRPERGRVNCGLVEQGGYTQGKWYQACAISESWFGLGMDGEICQGWM